MHENCEWRGDKMRFTIIQEDMKNIIEGRKERENVVVS